MAGVRRIVGSYRRIVLGAVAAATAGFLGLAGFLGYCAYTLPLTRGPVAEPAPAATLFETAAGQRFAARGIYRGETLGADQVPPDLAQAVVAIEDRRFFSHYGIDPRGILRAAWHNLWGSAGVEGGSTITQQLARLTYLSPERTVRRKVQEAMLAFWLESRLGKKEILAGYLNRVFFGAGAYGVDAAAKRYFGKNTGALTLAESAMLAGLIRAPSQLAPKRNIEAARRRADTVLAAMLELGFIDKERLAQAQAHPATLAIPPEPLPGQNYFVDAADAEIHRLMGSPPVDLTVRTTLDPRLQALGERTVEHRLAAEGARRDVSQAALVAMAPDGAILAIVGGRDYNESQFDRALQAHRQPGSLFKLIVYLAALKAGYTPDSMVVDQPIQIGNWEPHNFSGRYSGPLTLRTAFAYSINTVSVQLVQAIGVKRVIEMAKSLGIQSDLPAVPSLALGTAEVTRNEMVRAMDAVAINRKSVDAYTISAIRGHSQMPLYTRPEPAVELPTWNRTAMMQMLEGVVAEGTGRAARLDRRVGGKTGTADEYRDAWFVGFTSDLVVGVWVGNDDHSPMERVVGGDIPARIWHDFVAAAEPILATPQPAAPVATGPSAETAALRQNAPAAADGVELHGVPQVIDTGTLMLGGALVHLNGVEGEKGDPVHDLVHYIRSRQVDCAAVASGQYRCRIENFDLGEAIVLNGAGRAAPNAPERLHNAEEKARQAQRGIWRQ